MTATLSFSLMTGAHSLGVSGEAQYLDETVEAAWESLQRTKTFGSADLFCELEELEAECSEPDWDGYGAAPVTGLTVAEARRFLRSLPPEIGRPTLGAEPDGQVTFEWHAGPKRTLSVSISPDGELHYSALVGSERHYGTVPLLGDCPDVILDLAERVQQT